MKRILAIIGLSLGVLALLATFMPEPPLRPTPKTKFAIHLTYFALETNGPILSDAWNHPLMVAKRSDLLASNAHTKLVGLTNSTIVWSVGKNGSNENGYGDDIFLDYSPR